MDFRTVLQCQRAVHIGFGGVQFRIDEQLVVELAIVQVDGDVGPGRRSPKTWTLPSASRTRRVPWRMKRRSRLDNRRTWQSSVMVAGLFNNEPEKGHAAPNEAACTVLPVELRII